MLCYQVPVRTHACALPDIFQTEHQRTALYAILRVFCVAQLAYQGVLLATRMRNSLVEIPPPAFVSQDTSRIRLLTIAHFAARHVRRVLEG